MFRFLLIIAMSIGLAGCFETIPQQPPITIVKYKNVLIAPPDNLLVDCDLQEPPPVVDYLLGDWTKKEDFLSKAYQNSLSKTMVCNVRLRNLRSWKEDQVKVFQTPADPVSPQ